MLGATLPVEPMWMGHVHDFREVLFGLVDDLRSIGQENDLARLRPTLLRFSTAEAIQVSGVAKTT